MNNNIQQKIIEVLGLQTESKEAQEQIIGELGGLILQLILVKATEKMTDDEVIAFEKVLSSQNQEEMQAFLLKTIPDFESLVAEASKEVIEEYKKG